MKSIGKIFLIILFACINLILVSCISEKEDNDAKLLMQVEWPKTARSAKRVIPMDTSTLKIELSHELSPEEFSLVYEEILEQEESNVIIEKLKVGIYKLKIYAYDENGEILALYKDRIFLKRGDNYKEAQLKLNIELDLRTDQEYERYNNNAFIVTKGAIVVLDGVVKYSGMEEDYSAEKENGIEDIEYILMDSENIATLSEGAILHVRDLGKFEIKLVSDYLTDQVITQSFISLSLPNKNGNEFYFEEGIVLKNIISDMKVYGKKAIYEEEEGIRATGAVLELTSPNTNTLPINAEIEVATNTNKAALCWYDSIENKWKFYDTYEIINKNRSNTYIKAPFRRFDIIGVLEYTSKLAVDNMKDLFYIDVKNQKIAYKNNLDQYFNIKVISSDMELIDEEGNIYPNYEEEKTVNIKFELIDKETEEQSISEEYEWKIGTVLEEQLSEPIIHPIEGNYIGDLEVIIEGTTGATIYYTLDGTLPDENSNIYSEPILLTESAIVSVVVKQEGYRDSIIVMQEYKIQNAIQNEMIKVYGQLYERCISELDDYCTHSYIDSFEISKYEITKAQYHMLMPQDEEEQESLNYPKEVSWQQAIEYCNQLSLREGLAPAYDLITGQVLDKNGNPTYDLNKVTGYRLPSELEWEIAAYDATNKNIEQMAWTSKNSMKRIQEVGQMTPNSIGLYDMLYNAREWCMDWEYEGVSFWMDMGVNIYNHNKENNNKILKGGRIEDETYMLTEKTSMDKDTKMYDSGFRICRSIPKEVSTAPAMDIKVYADDMQGKVSGKVIGDNYKPLIVSINWDADNIPNRAITKLADNFQAIQENKLYTKEKDYKIIVEAIDNNGMKISQEYHITIPTIIPVAGKPEFSLRANDPTVPEDKYLMTQLLELHTNTSDAAIYYTLDGTSPSAVSNKYDGPIILAEDTKVKAVAIKEDMKVSPVLEGEFIIDRFIDDGMLRISNINLGYDYFIGRTELRVGEYMEFLNEKLAEGISLLMLDEYIDTASLISEGYMYYNEEKNIYEADMYQKDYPITNVKWKGATAFCNWKSEKENLNVVYDEEGNLLNSATGDSIGPEMKNIEGYRIPNLQEWEYAAKGGSIESTFSYSGSNNIDEVAWYIENSENKYKNLENGKGVHTVAQKFANKLGVHDMTGNVWEWVEKLGSTENTVLKGGGWKSSISECDIYYPEIYTDPTTSRNDIGVRIAKTRYGVPCIEYIEVNKIDTVVELTINILDQNEDLDKMTIIWDDNSENTVVDLNQSKDYQVSHEYLAYGEYAIKVLVEDHSGNQVEGQQLVNLVENRPPEIISFNINYDFGRAATVTAQIYDDKAVELASIDWGDGNKTDLNFPEQNISQSHEYTASGEYSIALKVIDEEGLTTTVNHTAVINVAPILDLTSYGGSMDLTLDGYADDEDGVVQTITIDWGDGNSQVIEGGTSNVEIYETHVYGESGKYTVTVYALDDKGKKSEVWTTDFTVM